METVERKKTLFLMMILVRKELLSERDGNWSCPRCSVLFLLLVRKELLSERDGNVLRLRLCNFDP